MHHFRESTKALMRRALLDLRRGDDITIVALPHDLAISIARSICKIAREHKITCANIPECDGQGPRVRVREYGAAIPFPTPKAKVHYDLSVVFERPMIVPERVRTVWTI